MELDNRNGRFWGHWDEFESIMKTGTPLIVMQLTTKSCAASKCTGERRYLQGNRQNVTSFITSPSQ